MKTVVVLTGAGISAESGIETFRGEDGLWEGYDIMEVASPQGWKNNMNLVLDFYNQRRRQLHIVSPNDAHKALVDLEDHYKVEIITQNVDDLHERAGNQHVTHLHGELFKVRSCADPNIIMDWKDDLHKGDVDHNNNQLRPHIVWFGEAVPKLEQAAAAVEKADILLIIGTSLVVYPAAGLKDFARPGTPIYLIDPFPSISEAENVHIIPEKASIGVPKIVKKLIS